MLPAQQATTSDPRSKYTHQTIFTYMYVDCSWCNWLLAARLIACTCRSWHQSHSWAGPSSKRESAPWFIRRFKQFVLVALVALGRCSLGERLNVDTRAQLQLHFYHALSTQTTQEQHYHTKDNIFDVYALQIQPQFVAAASIATVNMRLLTARRRDCLQHYSIYHSNNISLGTQLCSCVSYLSVPDTYSARWMDSCMVPHSNSLVALGCTPHVPSRVREVTKEPQHNN